MFANNKHSESRMMGNHPVRFGKGAVQRTGQADSTLSGRGPKVTPSALSQPRISLVHIRLELSSPGSQFIVDNQLYNSIITAHVRGKGMSMVQGEGFLYNLLASPENYSSDGSSSKAKKLFELSPLQQLMPSMRGDSVVLSKLRKCKFSKAACGLKDSFYTTENKTLDGGKHSLLKLGLTHLSAHRYYSTTPISDSPLEGLEATGKGKMRKDAKKTPTVVEVSQTLPNETPLSDEKERVAPKSSTTSQEASDGIAPSGPSGVIFDSLSNLEKTDGKFRKLIHLIASEEMLTYAYELIKSKPGNLTPSSNAETLDGIKKA